MKSEMKTPVVCATGVDKNISDRTTETNYSKTPSIRKYIKKLIVRYCWIAPSFACSPLNRLKKVVLN